MPTSIWIQETVEDRYWEGRETVAGPPAPPVFSCVVCGREFDSADGRSWHASEAHPLARPMLYLADRAAPSTVRVRAPMLVGDVSVASCTSVTAELDGALIEGLQADGLGALIASHRTGHIVLRLENHRAADAADVRSTYVLEIAIPDPDQLAQVDRAFVDRLAVDRPSTRDVESFASDVEPFSSARSYAGALADYVHGVLVKEGSEYGGATLPFEAFQAKFSRALAELTEHVDRPVAASVVAASRLNLNDIAQPSARTGDPRLDGCLRVLREAAVLEPVSPAEPVPLGSAVPLCPIDRDTHFVLTAYETLVADGSAGSRLEEFDGRADDGTLSPQDRAKLRVLLALGALRGEHRNVAIRHLEALAHDAIFRGWAERELERVA